MTSDDRGLVKMRLVAPSRTNQDAEKLGIENREVRKVRLEGAQTAREGGRMPEFRFCAPDLPLSSRLSSEIALGLSANRIIK